ncbi:MAG: orotidine-5'-phosphate decarboxylase [Magnetococcales bacterium]|nr:orotidine-5'-phosphate decarboxylase [Magnetococcales bacterium]
MSQSEPAKNIPLSERVIFALDVDTPERARQWVERLEDHVHFYKVGLQLFLTGGFPVVDWIMQRGHKVMVDLKFFDVPETVKLAVEQVARRGATFATVHGNDAIVRAAVGARGNVKILAVTVLTSFDESDLLAMGLNCTVEELVLRRARKALELDCDGIVCSGLEASKLRSHIGHQFLIVTPGIRPGQNIEIAMDDQKRIMTAYAAFRNGADHVVVGRPISRAEDPIAVIKTIRREIRLAIPTL